MYVKRDEGSTELHKVNAMKQISTLIAIIMSHLFYLQSPQFCTYISVRICALLNLFLGKLITR